MHILPCGAPQRHRSCDTYPCISPYRWCQRWLPSKILVRRVCTRRGLRWGVPLALLGLIHFTAGAGCVGAVQLGGSPWWYLGTVICWWTTLKLVGHGLYAAVMLPIVRARARSGPARADANSSGKYAPKCSPRIVRPSEHATRTVGWTNRPPTGMMGGQGLM